MRILNRGKPNPSLLCYSDKSILIVKAFYQFVLIYVFCARLKRRLSKYAKRIKRFDQFKNADFRSYLNYNRKKYQSSSSDNIILIDTFNVPQWVFVNSVLAGALSNIHRAQIISFGYTQRERYTDLLFKSFGCNSHIEILITSKMARERETLYLEMLSSISCKRDLIDYCIDGVNVGLDIYDTILRDGVPTVELDSLRVKKYIVIGLSIYLFVKDFFESNAVKALLVSHDNYIWMGTVARVAYKYNIPVFLANPYEIIRTRYTFHLYKRFQFYPQLFSGLSPQAQTNALLWAEEKLRRRLTGEVGVMMNYQRKSAFGSTLLSRQTNYSVKVKIVVATHCFFDNPNSLGWMLFPDFYEWLVHLGKLSNICDYEWYIKPHSDYLPGTLDVLSKICKLFPRFSIIDPSTTWHQLKDEGVSTVLTCYGSIGHELPLLGFKVINAAYNPHIAYKFNLHPKSIEEYNQEILTNISTPLPVHNEELYEFFYVHNHLTQPDDLFFESTSDYLAKVRNGKLGATEYQIYMDQAKSFDQKVISYFQYLHASDLDFIYE